MDRLSVIRTSMAEAEADHNCHGPEFNQYIGYGDVDFLLSEIDELRQDKERLEEERNTFMLRLNRLDKVIEPLVDRLHEQIEMARRGIIPDSVQKEANSA